MIITVLGVPLDGWAALNLVLQFLLPLLVGLVTTKETNRERQFLLLSVLTLLATTGAQILDAHSQGLPLNLVQILVNAVVNLAISLLAHYKVWKPTNLSDLVLAVFRTAPVEPEPVNPAPAAADASLPARHLYVAPTFRQDATAAGDLPLEPVSKVAS